MNSFKRDNSPLPITKENISTILDTDDIWQRAPDIISPKTAKHSPDCPILMTEGSNRIDQVAIFKERVLDTDKKDREIPIYNSRAAYFFMTKMATDGNEGCYSLCNACNPCTSSRSSHFFVMPKYTYWSRLGDLGVIINLNTRQQETAYAICADFGPDQTISERNNTLFKGRLGEGSIALCRHLKVKDSEIGDGSRGFQPDNMLYIVFQNSSFTIFKRNKVYTLKELNELAHSIFQCWGGWKYAQYVVKQKYGLDLNPS